MSSEFEKLASELETLAKAQPATEEDKVLAAAKDAGVNTDEIGDAGDGADAGAASDGDGDEDDGDEDGVLGKSFQVMGGSGSPVKAYDATALIKSLVARLDVAESELADVAERREHLGKSLGLITDLIKSQSEQIDALKKAVVELGGQGRGRQAVLTVTEKPAPAMAKSVQEEGLSGKDFMAKAMDAQRAGRISGHEVSVAEGSLNRGIAVPAHIVSRVMGNQ